MAITECNSKPQHRKSHVCAATLPLISELGDSTIKKSYLTITIRIQWLNYGNIVDIWMCLRMRHTPNTTIKWGTWWWNSGSWIHDFSLTRFRISSTIEKNMKGANLRYVWWSNPFLRQFSYAVKGTVYQLVHWPPTQAGLLNCWWWFPILRGWLNPNSWMAIRHWLVNIFLFGVGPFFLLGKLARNPLGGEVPAVSG